jgi:hypothetical protein
MYDVFIFFEFFKKIEENKESLKKYMFHFSFGFIRAKFFLKFKVK